MIGSPAWCHSGSLMSLMSRLESNMKLTIDATKTSIDSYDPEVSCAVMKNHKAIKPDDKIILYVKKACSEPALKRQKTSDGSAKK